MDDVICEWSYHSATSHNPQGHKSILDDVCAVSEDHGACNVNVVDFLFLFLIPLQGQSPGCPSRVTQVAPGLQCSWLVELGRSVELGLWLSPEGHPWDFLRSGVRDTIPCSCVTTPGWSHLGHGLLPKACKVSG